MEEAFPATKAKRVDDQPEFVDQAVRQQRPYQAGTAVDDDVLPRLLFQLRDFRHKITLDQVRIVPRELRQGPRRDELRHAVEPVREPVRVFPAGPSRREPLIRHASQENRVRGEGLVELELLGLLAPEWEGPLLGRFDDAVQRHEQGGGQRARSRHRFSSVRATEDQYFSLRGGAERQGHESELDEETTVGAALEPIQDGRAGSPPALRRVITLRHAVAIYVSSLLGSGIFVIPGLAAPIAGAGSIGSWMLLSLASYPFAYTLAKLSAKRPGSRGSYDLARDGIGLRAGAAPAWLFLPRALPGAPPGTDAAASL